MESMGILMSIWKNNALSAMQSWVHRPNHHGGYWLTLDATRTGQYKPDAIAFEKLLGQFMQRLNNYCYGRAFRRKQKQLVVCGAIEIGHFMDRPHAHLVILHDTEMQRSFNDVALKARELWCALTGAQGNIYGNLVDIQPVGDIASRLSYAAKQFVTQSDQYGRLVMY
jgi:hypothetical protein